MASYGKDAVEGLRNLSECCICLTTYTDPRILSCFHTCCLNCFESFQKKNEKKNGEVLPCPLCRKEFTIPPEGMKGLQKNFFVENLIEMTKALDSGTKRMTCSICSLVEESGSVREVEMRCLTCCENYCLRCTKIHQGQKLTKDHKIVPMNASLKEEEIRNMFPIRNCNKHLDKVLDYYCSDCKTVVCVSCFVEEHKLHECKDVKTVDKDFRKTLDINCTYIAGCSEQMVSRKIDTESQKREYLEKVSATEAAILDKAQRLKALIDQHAKDMLDELSLLKQKHKKMMETQIEEVGRRKAILDSFVLYCTELTSKGSASEVCSSVASLTSRANELKEDTDKYWSNPCKSVDVELIETDQKILLQNAGNLIGKVTEYAKPFENHAIVISRHDFFNFSNEVIKIHLNRSENVSNLPPLPTKMLIEASATNYCNSVFVTGTGNTFNEIWKFDRTSSSWKQCASLVRGREGHSVAFVDHVMYICGGRGVAGRSVLYDVEAYDSIGNKCSTVGHLKFAVRCSGNCVPFKDSLYIFGGLDVNGKNVNSVQVYDTKSNTCSLLSKPIPEAASYLRAVLWNNSVIMLNNIMCFVYNFDTETFQMRDQFRTDVSNFGVSVANGKIFIIGGTKGTTCSDDIKSIPIWNILCDEPIEWKHHAVLPWPWKVFASGGIEMVA